MLQVIIDTDIGCDSDDAGALAVAFALEAEGFCRLEAVTHCTSRPDGCAAIDAIGRYYGRPDIPVGIYKPDGFLDDPSVSWYSRFLQAHFPGRFSDKKSCPDALAVMRRALAGMEEGNGGLVGIGPMKNLAALLDSGGDAVSPLSGRELLRMKNCPLVLMAGCFDDAFISQLEKGAEWNVKQAVYEAQYVLDSWPTEVYVVPFETGVNIRTGLSLQKGPPDNPVRVAYERYARQSGDLMRSSWDLCTVHFAITRDPSLWGLSENGKIAVDSEGVTSFQAGRGSHYIVRALAADRAEQVLETWMCQPPPQRRATACTGRFA